MIHRTFGSKLRRCFASGHRATLALAGLGLLLGGFPPSIGSADPVDVGAEIAGPAAEEAADRLGNDWIRSEARTSEALEADQIANSERQRKLVDTIARRQLGDQLDRTKGDLRILQRILDEKRLGANPPDTVQALGVVLGDVLVAQAGYHWIRFEDERGRSRALRSRDGKTVAFPVTAIERVRDLDMRPDVAGIYDELAAMGGAETSP
ncbi:MAG: DUF3806 domain-containing protein [Myxococcota bacterium]